jgi:prevent-host-death family protein
METSLHKVSVVEVKARFSEILASVEAGKVVVITRRGLPVARMSAMEPHKKPMDLRAIDALRAGMTPARRPSVELIRKLRDERY